MTVPKKKLNDGTEIPMLGFGTWQIEGEKCTEAVKTAIEVGYRHIDTAFAYYNESFVGPGLKDISRDELFVTTKLWREFHDPKRVEEACDRSLKDLGIDHLDLYLIHWPERKNSFPEMVHEMHKLKEKGKIRSVGLCNSTIHHIQDLYNQKLEIAVNQIEFHPFLVQSELLKFCLTHNIAVTAYSPLARGEALNNELLKEIGQKYGKSPGQVTLKWLMQKDIIVIPKSSSEPHMRENFEIFDFKLTEEEILKVDGLNENKRLIVPDFQEFDY